MALKLGDYDLNDENREAFHRGWYAYLHCAKLSSFDGEDKDKEAWEQGWAGAQNLVNKPIDFKGNG